MNNVVNKTRTTCSINVQNGIKFSVRPIFQNGYRKNIDIYEYINSILYLLLKPQKEKRSQNSVAMIQNMEVGRLCISILNCFNYVY